MSSPTGEEFGYPAYHCPFCHRPGIWRLSRIGDAVVSWSCEAHVSWVLDTLQRDDRTEIRVTKASTR